MEESNKTLALLLVAAIVVSLGGTIVSLNKLGEVKQPTGYVFTTGNATIEITATYVVNVTDRLINFSSGQLNDGINTCTLSSNETAGLPTDCGTWSWVADYLEYENIGSSSIDVSVQSDENAAEFIGGVGPGFKFICKDSGDGGAETYPASAWTTFDKSAQQCVEDLEPEAADNTARLDVQVTIGTDVTGGWKTSVLTFAAGAPN